MRTSTVVMSSKTVTMITSTRNLPLSNIWQASRVYYGGFQKWGLQSRQVKRTLQGSIKELIIGKMNPFVVPVNTTVDISACAMSSEYFTRTSLYLIRLKIFQWIKFLRRRSNQIQGNWAGRNVLTAWRMNSRPHTPARMQRWIWNLQLPTDSTFE